MPRADDFIIEELASRHRSSEVGTVVTDGIEFSLITSDENLVFITRSYLEVFHFSVLKTRCEVYLYLVHVLLGSGHVSGLSEIS